MLATWAPAHGQPASGSVVLDRGSLLIYLGDRAVGAETFAIEARADSVTAGARSYRTMRTAQGDESIEKQMMLSMSRADHALRYYQSNETFRGQTLLRGVVADAADTVLTVFRERKEGGGVADRLAAPPGRLFVLDSGLYTLFNLICMSLHGKSFTTRPLSVLTFGERDSLLEVRVTDLGTETIRWGHRPVQARKLQITDGPTTFLLWAGPSGILLRLTHQASGLRVERDAPPVKRPSPAPKRGG